MFCHHCGQEIQGSYQYCPRCGVELPAAGAAAQPSRMQTHVKILAALYIVYSLIGLIGSISLLLALTAVGTFLAALIGAAPGMQTLLQGLLGSLGALGILESAAGVATGVGLLQYRLWARSLAILLNVINLLHIPFGTLVGLYGLWVLISTEGERHYRQMAPATG